MTTGSKPHIRPAATVELGLRLSDCGLLDRENALVCDVAVKTIRRWRRLYRRRGQARGPGNSMSCPRCAGTTLDDSAYANLLGWYLGDGHIVRSRTKPVYSLAIVNDERYPGLNDALETLLVRVKGGGSVTRRHHSGYIELKLCWKHWPCLFPQHGRGMKHARRIALEPWQEQVVRNQPGRFLRGLFHSDGCRIRNWATRTANGITTRYEYDRYFFDNTSEDILGLCTWALDLLDIPWKRPTKKQITVNRRAAVAALDEHVGPKY